MFCFKQLCNNSQERIPVSVATYTYLLVQTVIRSPYYRLATASEFCCTKPRISFAAGCTVDTHSPHCCTLLISVALLTRRVRARPGGLLTRFSAGFRGLPTSSRLMPSERNPATVLARILWAFAAWSFEQHWPLSLNGLYLFRTRWYGAKMCYN